MGKRGPKPGTGGRPKKALYDNILDGNPGKRTITVLSDDLKQDDADFTAPDFLSDRGKQIYEETVAWLIGTDCLGFINPQHIAEYAHCRARWLECEAFNDRDLLSKHPTTNQPMQSPYVDIGLKYLRQADTAWAKIWDIVKENSRVEFRKGNPNQREKDEMAELFRSKETKE